VNAWYRLIVDTAIRGDTEGFPYLVVIDVTANVKVKCGSEHKKREAAWHLRKPGRFALLSIPYRAEC
jgi:hypothetical protein